jgi:hypothetical protein
MQKKLLDKIQNGDKNQNGKYLLTEFRHKGHSLKNRTKLDEGSSQSLAIWFIIQYHKTRIFLFWPKKIFCRFYEFLKKFGFAQKKNRKTTLLAVNNALFNRFP